MNRKFNKFGFFGSIIGNQVSIGIHKVGVIIVSSRARTTGTYVNGRTTNVTLAGRIIGFTDFIWTTRKVSKAEATGLMWENGIAGTERTFDITRHTGKTPTTRRVFRSFPYVATANRDA